MGKIKNGAKTAAIFIEILILIFDAKTALAGAAEGANLCIKTMIPSLFPFIVLSMIAGGQLAGGSIPLERGICRVYRIPAGTASLLVLGALGGYPVGAQCLYDWYKNGMIQKKTARRMLGFCNNAGPAFIFGVIGQLFPRPLIPFLLWGIHILSGMLVARIIPGDSEENCCVKSSGKLSLTTALERAVKTMGLICGWVILFRVVVAFCDRWFLWLLPPFAQAAFVSALELSNGFVKVAQLASPGARFILCAFSLGFGGMCVALQTASVSKELGTGWYFPGKVLQSMFSVMMAIPIQYLLFPDGFWSVIPLVFVLAMVAIAGILILGIGRKKRVAIPG